MALSIYKDVDDFLVETDTYIQDVFSIIYKPDPIIDISISSIGLLSLLSILYIGFSIENIYDL